MTAALSLRSVDFLALYCLYSLQGSAQAQESQSSSNGALLGLAVGVSVATSLVTTLVTLLVAYLVMKHSRRKKARVERGEPVRNSNSSRYSDASTKPLFKRSESQDTSLSQQCNGDARYRSSTRQAIANHNRFKSDYTSKFCTDNALTEATAQCLRDKGFTTRAAIEALRVEDLEMLELKTVAERCKLREVINRRLRPSGSQSSMNRQRSTSEENLPSPGVRDTDTSGGSSMFDRSSSLHQIDSVDGVMPIGKPLRIRKKSMGSMEIIETSDGEVVYYNNGGGAIGVPHRGVQPMRPVKEFKGLLSDSGLYDLAKMIGCECMQLATLLRVPTSKQDQIRMDNPGNMLRQIFENLRIWRDSSSGNKEEIKGQLYNALMKCSRSDLAEDLLQEVVEGSQEQVTYHSII